MSEAAAAYLNGKRVDALVIGGSAERIAAGTVYFAPPGYHLLVETHGHFALSVDEPVHFSRPAIDVLFEFAADAYAPHVLG